MVLVTSLGPRPQSSTQCQQIFTSSTVCLVWLALGARQIPYGISWCHEGSVVPSRSEDELGTTKVTDRSNYTLLTKAQHKDEDDDESVDKFKTDEPVETNATEIAIETKLVEPEEELYKPYKTNSIESRIETKKIKPKTEKVKSFVLEKKFDIEVDAEDEPKQHKNMKQKIQK